MSYSFLSLLQVCQNITELVASIVTCIACTTFPDIAGTSIFLTYWTITQSVSKKPVCRIWWWTLQLKKQPYYKQQS